MTRARPWSIVGLLVLASGWGCSRTPADPIEQSVLQPGDACANFGNESIPTFTDANLEARVRVSLAVDLQSNLTCGLLASLTSLMAGNAGIRSLVGAQNLTGVTDLELHANSIGDVGSLSGLTTLTRLTLDQNTLRNVAPLSGLTSLRFLSLHENATISDITPLGGLTSLTHLRAGGNSISDISVVGGFTSLTQLSLWDNAISDVNAVEGLTSLTYLSLSANPISDIGATGGLTNLESLFLAANPALSDIQPLLANAGLGTGDMVDLTGTGVTCEDVTALRSNGVTVTSPCP
jgi:Leucine-rich repeat (LRR) protein